MIKHVVGSKIVKKEQVLISIFLIAILVLSSGSMVAFADRSQTLVVKPSGDTSGATDTPAIQAALNKCTSGDPRCTVQLLSGTYYISSQITVYGFQGSLVGAGQGQTNIVALGNMPSPNPAYNIPCQGYPTCTSTTGTAGGVPYWAGYPGMGPDGTGSPQGSGTPNPWPALFTFEGGSIAISAMTLTDTSPTPTMGYYMPAIDGSGFYQGLISAIIITGPPAPTVTSATIDHVSMVGGAGDWGGYNIGDGVWIAGRVLPSGWSNPDGDPYPITGTYSVTNSKFVNVETPAAGDILVNSNLAICGNAFSNSVPPTSYAINIEVFDNSNTNVLICNNQGTMSDANDVVVFQGLFRSGLSPFKVTITGNNFQVNDEGSAVAMYDFEPYSGAAPTLSAVVSGNTFQNSYAEGVDWYASVFYSISLKSTIVSSNNIAGGGSDGIYLNGGPGAIIGNTITGAANGVLLDVASGVHVAGNVIRNTGVNGIVVMSFNYAGSAITTPSSNDYVIGNFVHNSGTADLYWDGLGTNNHWCGNIYKTSSPSVLPGC